MSHYLKPTIITHETGQRLLELIGGFSSENISAAEQLNYDILYLSDGDWINFSGIENLSNQISSLYVKTYGHFNIEALHFFKNLKYLKIDIPQKNINGNLTFNNFSKLEDCFLFWSKNFDKNLFKLPTLEKLTLISFNGEFKELSSLNNLKYLSIYGGVSSIEGIEKMGSLIDLHISNMPKLTDLSPIAEISSSLETLKLDRCSNIHDFSFLKEMHKIKSLNIGNNADFTHIYKLKSLEDLIAYNPRPLDLFLMLSLQKIEKIELIQAKNFDYTIEDIEKYSKLIGITVKACINGKGNKKYVFIEKISRNVNKVGSRLAEFIC